VRQRQEWKVVGLHHIPGEDGNHADENQRNHGRDAEYLGGIGRAQYPAVLNGFDREHDDGAQQKYRVDAQGKAVFDRTQIEQRDRPGIDPRLRGEQRVQYVAGGERRSGGLYR